MRQNALKWANKRFMIYTAIIIHNHICCIKKFTKKIYKKLYIKIEKRQRSGWRPNRGRVPSVHKAAQYRRVTDVSHLYCTSVQRGACRFRGRAVCMMDFEGRALFPRLVVLQKIIPNIRLKRPSGPKINAAWSAPRPRL